MKHYSQIAVLSGKGGTGKTTLTGSLAVLARRKVMVDGDVDAANLHLLLRPTDEERHEFAGAKVAVRDAGKCRRCGECERLCRFGAITPDAVNPFACEGCGLCVAGCPAGALRLEEYVCGEYSVGSTPYGPLVHAHLRPGAENSGRLVTVVRQKADELALSRGLDLIIIDGAPGIGCTAVAAMADVDAVVIVTEPTLSAMHDMERVARLAAHFRVPTCVFINKWDLHAENTREIEAACDGWGLVVIGRMPYSEVVPRAIAAGVPLVEYGDDGLAGAVEAAWARLAELVAQAA